MKHFKVKKITGLQAAHWRDIKKLGLPFALIGAVNVIGGNIDFAYTGGVIFGWIFPPSFIAMLILFIAGFTRQLRRSNYFRCPSCDNVLQAFTAKHPFVIFPCAQCEIIWDTDLEYNSPAD